MERLEYDVDAVEVNVKFSFWDRLRVLFTGRTMILVSYEAGRDWTR